MWPSMVVAHLFSAFNPSKVHTHTHTVNTHTHTHREHTHTVNTHTHREHTHTHTHTHTVNTHTAVGSQCSGTWGAFGGSVSCSRATQSYWIELILKLERVLYIHSSTYNPCWTWDSNSQPLDYESDSLTIRPRLPQSTFEVDQNLSSKLSLNLKPECVLVLGQLWLTFWSILNFDYCNNYIYIYIISALLFKHIVSIS